MQHIVSRLLCMITAPSLKNRTFEHVENGARSQAHECIISISNWSSSDQIDKTVIWLQPFTMSAGINSYSFPLSLCWLRIFLFPRSSNTRPLLDSTYARNAKQNCQELFHAKTNSNYEIGVKLGNSLWKTEGWSQIEVLRFLWWSGSSHCLITLHANPNQFT